MSAGTVIAVVLAFAIAAYLVYILLRPEEF